MFPRMSLGEGNFRVGDAEGVRREGDGEGIRREGDRGSTLRFTSSGTAPVGHPAPSNQRRRCGSGRDQRGAGLWFLYFDSLRSRSHLDLMEPNGPRSHGD